MIVSRTKLQAQQFYRLTEDLWSGKNKPIFMAGRLDKQPRNLIIEELAARAAVEENPDGTIEQENLGLPVFLALTTFAKKHLPQDEPVEPKTRTHPTRRAEDQTILSQRFANELSDSLDRDMDIISSNHFLEALVKSGDSQVRVEIQVEPGPAWLLKEPRGFRVSLPDSTMDDVFVIGKDGSKVESRGRHHLRISTSEIVYGRPLPTFPNSEREFTENDVLTVMQLLADVNQPSTEVTYRSVRKPSC